MILRRNEPYSERICWLITPENDNEDSVGNKAFRACALAASIGVDIQEGSCKLICAIAWEDIR